MNEWKKKIITLLILRSVSVDTRISSHWGEVCSHPLLISLHINRSHLASLTKPPSRSGVLTSCLKETEHLSCSKAVDRWNVYLLSPISVCAKPKSWLQCVAESLGLASQPLGANCVFMPARKQSFSRPWHPLVLPNLSSYLPVKKQGIAPSSADTHAHVHTSTPARLCIFKPDVFLLATVQILPVFQICSVFFFP